MQGIKQSLLATFFSLLLSPALQGHISTSGSIDQICTGILDDTSCPASEKYVFFDIDYTLGRCFPRFNLVYNNLFSQVLMNSSQTQTMPLKDRIHYLFTLLPMENNTVNAVKKLQQAGVKVMALTARSSKLHQRTFEQLREMGLNFDQALPLETQMWSEPGICDACFYKGVICCSNLNKGIALTGFIKEHNKLNTLKISKVYVADDLDFNIVNVHNSMEQLGIPCHAILYK